mgnify:CR=1 FL=1
MEPFIASWWWYFDLVQVSRLAYNFTYFLIFFISIHQERIQNRDPVWGTERGKYHAGQTRPELRWIPNAVDSSFCRNNKHFWQLFDTTTTKWIGSKLMHNQYFQSIQWLELWTGFMNLPGKSTLMYKSLWATIHYLLQIPHFAFACRYNV